MLSAMHAIAKITTSVAEVIPSPMPRSAKGRATSARAAIKRCERSRFIGLLEALNAFAEEAARAHEQHDEHHRVDDGGRELREAGGDREPLDEADEQRRHHDAAERAQAADHDHD